MSTFFADGQAVLRVYRGTTTNGVFMTYGIVHAKKALFFPSLGKCMKKGEEAMDENDFDTNGQIPSSSKGAF